MAGEAKEEVVHQPESTEQNHTGQGGIVDPECLIKHPLQFQWTLWYQEPDKNKSGGDSLNEVATVGTVEDFWKYNHIKSPLDLKTGGDYSSFKQGLRPTWEDEKNFRGGRWVINVGEVFDNPEEICGAVVNVRQKMDKIAIWTSTVMNRDAPMQEKAPTVHEKLKRKKKKKNWSCHRCFRGSVFRQNWWRTGSEKQNVGLSGQKLSSTEEFDDLQRKSPEKQVSLPPASINVAGQTFLELSRLAIMAGEAKEEVVHQPESTEQNHTGQGGIVDPECLIKHPLQFQWTLWYQEPDKNKSGGDSLNEVATVGTVEDFWKYNHIKSPSDLKTGGDYSSFKQGLRPMWEDEKNFRGGRWVINVGEVFDNPEEICGAVVNVHQKMDKIAIWTSTVMNRDAPMQEKAVSRFFATSEQ
ncbi:uncharacterized protein LOC129739935 [Uranotaenia lowii]|uniref:uncharacterized protein LOC129739935 n=1 Tax=Uranotaenia lowii TaxID=190385 RepID=UPI0024789049|nr:uncharacterized protein LOC129739935 [Uranotaenia lowii]